MFLFVFCLHSSRGESESGERDKEVEDDVFRTNDETDSAQERISATCSVTTLRESESSPARLFTKVASTSTDCVFYSLPRVENETKIADTQVLKYFSSFVVDSSMFIQCITLSSVSLF